ncbi:permease [Gorillibacterium timonense]|uniref:permease n=1 Tax=Gorillibacterium timonense TaxID=1689269 RepID=UPI000AC720C9|nr:permease [Gorillibacterium timonense]
MRRSAANFGIHLLFGLAMFLIIWIAMNPGGILKVPSFGTEGVQTFKTMFISIFLEALPYLIIGVLVSAILQVVVPEAWIRRFVPKNPILGIAFGCLLGILFPLCECGMIPVVRRLIRKGMPLYVGVVFILVGPIVNPIVFAATYTAFRIRPEMVYARMGLALLVGLVIGLILYAFVKSDPLKTTKEDLYRSEAAESGEGPEEESGTQAKGMGKLFAVMEQAGGEIFDMGKYLIFGSVMTSLIQAFVPRAGMAEIGQQPIVSHLFMIGFAYVLSLCSTSDAFVASSFARTFSSGSLLTFLVFGPMLDFKSTLMLLSVFKPRFVLLLAGLITVTVLIGSLILSHYALW